MPDRPDGLVRIKLRFFLTVLKFVFQIEDGSTNRLEQEDSHGGKPQTHKGNINVNVR